MKTILYTIALLVITTITFSQVSKPVSKMIFLDSSDEETSEGNHKYYRIIRGYFSESEAYEFNDYYKSGNIKTKVLSKNRDYMDMDGAFITYYENGKKKSISNYKDKKKIGKEFNYFDDGALRLEIEYLENEGDLAVNYKVIEFWNKKRQQKVVDGNGEYQGFDLEGTFLIGIIKNGLREGKWTGSSLKQGIKIIEFYTKGKLISGTSTDSNNIERNYTTLLEKPKPDKGLNHFYSFVSKNFTVPREFQINRISEKIIVKFIIERDGTITDSKIIRGINDELDKEAIRVITDYEGWTVGKMRGLPLRVSYTIPITIAGSN
ncbi:antitoxin component YwqK of YwqJK toxin-antitoxin module [Flavobacterium sp. PL11]|jgi:antitoxin component YwqK of YwqJK toxin-antitoxin module|uniref:energy transducer TonB n=1 Tax=Flavobacterium sp. PL11 TaxID=3071717 RepID=UPI002DF92CF3|nr:antitoxin component YwqK of YwqJK toxin-antitoxin module [Flavobacterium sp. PL11]